MAKNIVCIGSAVLDITVHLEKPLEIGNKNRGLSGDIVAGGGSVISAAMLQSLGTPAEVWARIGDDEAGFLLRRLLKKIGVSDKGLVEVADHFTTFAAVGINAKDRTTFVRPDLTLPPAVEKVDFRRLSSASGILATTRWPEITESAFKIANLYVIPTVLNMEATKEPLPDTLVSLASHVIFSEQGLVSWTEEENFITALQAAKKRLPNSQIILTLGADGALVCQADDIVHVPAVPCENVVDTLGAGDIAHAVFINSLAHSWKKTTIEAWKLAAVAASLKVGRVGLKTLPSEREIHTAYYKNKELLESSVATDSSTLVDILANNKKRAGLAATA